MSDTGVAAEVPALESGALQRILDGLQAELGDAVVESVHERGDLWVRVERTAWHRAVEVCKRKLGLTFFSFLSGIDWMPNPELSGEKSFTGEEAEDEEGADDDVSDDGPVDMTTGVAGGDSRFQVFARLHDVRRHAGVTLKADLDDADPRVESIVDLFRGADWHERETFEMFGFVFDGHPSLRRLYLPHDFEGHPLRKDFPLLSREVKPWPGLVNVEQIPDHLDPKKIEAAREAAAEQAASGSDARVDVEGSAPEEADE